MFVTQIWAKKSHLLAQKAKKKNKKTHTQVNNRCQDAPSAMISCKKRCDSANYFVNYLSYVALKLEPDTDIPKMK